LFVFLVQNPEHIAVWNISSSR